MCRLDFTQGKVNVLLTPKTELAMVESFGAHYVSLHVRVSNGAAIHLYKDTLGFQNEKTEKAYYADGEDAYSMRLDLSSIREQIQDDAESEGVDEGEAVGDVGSDPAKKKTKKKAAGDGEKDKRKVKVGRGLGVGELVEKNEAKQP